MAGDVVSAMRGKTIRGNKVSIRIDPEEVQAGTLKRLLASSFVPRATARRPHPWGLRTHPFFRNISKEYALRAFAEKSEIARGNEAGRAPLQGITIFSSENRTLCGRWVGYDRPMNVRRIAMPLSRRWLAVGIVIASCAFSAGCAEHAGTSALPAVSGASVGHGGPASVAGGATVWTQTDAVKILPDEKPVARNSSIVAGGALGESVSYQLVVSATKGGLSRVVPAVGDLSDGHGHVLVSATDIALYR